MAIFRIGVEAIFQNVIAYYKLAAQRKPINVKEFAAFSLSYEF